MNRIRVFAFGAGWTDLGNTVVDAGLSRGQEPYHQTSRPAAQTVVSERDVVLHRFPPFAAAYFAIGIAARRASKSSSLGSSWVGDMVSGKTIGWRALSEPAANAGPTAKVSAGKSASEPVGSHVQPFRHPDRSSLHQPLATRNPLAPPWMSQANARPVRKTVGQAAHCKGIWLWPTCARSSAPDSPRALRSLPALFVLTASHRCRRFRAPR